MGWQYDSTESQQGVLLISRLSLASLNSLPQLGGYEFGSAVCLQPGVAVGCADEWQCKTSFDECSVTTRAESQFNIGGIQGSKPLADVSDELGTPNATEDLLDYRQWDPPPNVTANA
ncbi:MAG: hypothetical protein Aurels2KO_54490 [Aureliella sp.]